MKFRHLLCNSCATKIRFAEALYKKQRRKLKIKVVEPAISGKVKINKHDLYKTPTKNSSKQK